MIFFRAFPIPATQTCSRTQLGAAADQHGGRRPASSARCSTSEQIARKGVHEEAPAGGACDAERPYPQKSQGEKSPLQIHFQHVIAFLFAKCPLREHSSASVIRL